FYYNGTSYNPAVMNTQQAYAVMNLSLNITPDTGDGCVNLTAINITIAGIAGAGNISAIEIRNSTGVTIVSNTTSVGDNFTLWMPGGGLNISIKYNYTFFIYMNISPLATGENLNFTVNLTSNMSIVTNVAENNNVSIVGIGPGIPNRSASSSLSWIQDMHSNISVTPHVVDTNVTNQTFVIILTNESSDEITNVTITLPDGYNITNVKYIKYGSTILYDPVSGTNTSHVLGFEARNISINFTGKNNRGNITINITAHTNVTNITTQSITVMISGFNITNISAYPLNASVTIQQIAANVSIKTAKTAAYNNGTDYWEFNITFNTTTNVSGVLQFKMDNWLDSAGNTLGLNTTDGTYYATLRSNTNASSYDINITTQYNNSAGWGVPLNLSTLTPVTIYLRMVIPTTATVSSSWWTVYRMVFRATP
ncbi:MAG: hypothetical protein HZB67_00085, partial [Candidatus Aenigmarchaeota archaeon]|nr:hypothetical protein [Candidatus Aenigmarchaeota archaeon]